MTRQLRLLLCETDGRSHAFEVRIDQVILVGYSGRDRAAVRAHIDELEQLGVAPPPTVPALYFVPPPLVTTGDKLVVASAETSGEAEFVLVPGPDGLLIAAGSDHTDRAHEAIDVAESKSLCGKVISREVWLLQSLESHWDHLELRAWTSDGVDRRLYQEGLLAALLTPEQLLEEVHGVGRSTSHALVFSGTLPTIGGVAFGSHFEVELYEPVLHRRLRCAYEIIGPKGNQGAAA